MSKTGKFPISKFKTYGVPIINPDKGHNDRETNKSINKIYVLLYFIIFIIYLIYFHHFSISLYLSVNFFIYLNLLYLYFIVFILDPGPGVYNPKHNFLDKVLTKNNTNSGFSFNRLTRDSKLYKGTFSKLIINNKFCI
jgi:hypothetical protein